MSYPGNSSLSADIQERILATYRQTLELASQGNRQEASLGCDFILRLDTQFAPAKLLMERLEGGKGPVEVADLELGVTGNGPSAGAAPPPELAEATGESGDLDLGSLETGELDDVDLELPDLALDDLDAEPPAAASPAAGGLREELDRLLAERRFAELLSRAEAEREAVLADPDLSRIVTDAQERQQAEPYIQDLLASAEEARAAGRQDEADRLIAKVRNLDPDHPQLDALGEPGAPAAAADDPGDFLSSDPSQPALEEDPASLDAGPLAGSSEESESDVRIRELLDEGQEAFDRTDYQGAIDAWSRIFLIDIDHEGAASRIDEARRLKAEQERQVEEIFHEGVASLDNGDLEAARASFGKVLELQPGHLTAKEYLEQIESGRTPEVSAGDRAGAPSMSGLGPRLEEPPGDVELKEEILVPPEPGAAPEPVEEAPSRRVVATAKDRGGRAFLLIGGVVLVVVLGVGWFLFSNWNRFFPNAAGETSPVVATEDPITRATQLRESGRTTYAVTQLRRIPPTDPHYQEAQALISQWEAETPEATAEEQAAAENSGLEAREVTRRDNLLADARAAVAGGENLRATELFEQAAAIAPLGRGDRDLLTQAQDRLEPLKRQIELIQGGDWEFALPQLWRLREEQPGNPDVTRLIIDGHYNLGVRELQRGDANAALEHFEEAVALAPDDEAMRRHLLFARSYQGRSKDLLYQIYVKYLPFR